MLTADLCCLLESDHPLALGVGGLQVKRPGRIGPEASVAPPVDVADVTNQVARPPFRARRDGRVPAGALSSGRQQLTLAAQRGDMFGDLHRARVYRPAKMFRPGIRRTQPTGPRPVATSVHATPSSVE